MKRYTEDIETILFRLQRIEQSIMDLNQQQSFFESYEALTHISRAIVHLQAAKKRNWKLCEPDIRPNV